MTQVKELYTRVGQEDRPEVDLIDKEDALIGNLHRIIPATHHMLSVWHINKTFKLEPVNTFPKKEYVRFGWNYSIKFVKQQH